MKEFFKYDINELMPLLGKRISHIFFKEDYRFPNGSSSYFEPFYDRFSGIQNLGIWYMDGDDHYSIKFYCVSNGRFAYKDEQDNEKLTYYGIRSIGFKKDDDLNFRKIGSIYLTPASNFRINMSDIVTKISLQQEVSTDIIDSYSGRTIYPRFENSSYLPDRIVIEGQDFYMVIRAFEDDDQNLHLTLNVGYKFKTTIDYMHAFTEPDEMKIILIDQIEL